MQCTVIIKQHATCCLASGISGPSTLTCFQKAKFLSSFKQKKVRSIQPLLILEQQSHGSSWLVSTIVLKALEIRSSDVSEWVSWDFLNPRNSSFIRKIQILRLYTPRVLSSMWLDILFVFNLKVVEVNIIELNLCSWRQRIFFPLFILGSSNSSLFYTTLSRHLTSILVFSVFTWAKK